MSTPAYLVSAPAASWIAQADAVQSFPLIWPGEAQILTFNLAPRLAAGNYLVQNPAPYSVIVCNIGNDNNPNLIQSGPVSLAGGTAPTQILMTVKPALMNAQYTIKVVAATNVTGIVVACVGILNVGYP